jgi:hypothetical protein
LIEHLVISWQYRFYIKGSGGLRKALKNHVQEFVFCESPHLVSSSPETSETSEKGWWFSSESGYNALEVTDCQKGFFS